MVLDVHANKIHGHVERFWPMSEKNWGKTVEFPIKVQVDGYPILEHIHLDANANVPKNHLVLYDWTGGF